MLKLYLNQQLKMKYAAIAALMVLSTEAKGCKKGIAMKFYKDKKCETSVTIKEDGEDISSKEVSQDNIDDMNKCWNDHITGGWGKDAAPDAKSYNVLCDKKQASFIQYSKKDCEGDKLATNNLVWGSCHKLGPLGEGGKDVFF